MAHFAELDENNKVLQVIVVRNEDTLDRFGNESEEAGIEYCQAIFGPNTRWKQTSYNNRFRLRYAEIGGSYDPVKDIFIRAKQYDSWVFDETVSDWTPPVPRPEDGKRYFWNEDIVNWSPLE